MKIFIPLHHACTSLDNDAYIPILLEKGQEGDETYLCLDHGDDPKFDLQICNEGGKILAAPALHKAYRDNRDDSPATDAQFYTARGHDIANSIAFGSSAQYLAAWLNEDRKQANFCNDLDAVLSLNILDKCPQWIRYDLMSCLEYESSKQVFAKHYLRKAKEEQLKIPMILLTEIQRSADDATNPLLSTLMAEAMQSPPKYTGSAKIFDDKAQARIRVLQAL